MFEEEKPHLQPLPLLGVQYFTEAQRTVCDDSCVRVDHSSYAARPAPIGSRVLVRVFGKRLWAPTRNCSKTAGVNVRFLRFASCSEHRL